MEFRQGANVADEMGQLSYKKLPPPVQWGHIFNVEKKTRTKEEKDVC